MKLHFNGAARTVTGSQYLLEINGQLLLLECGMYQGKRDQTYQNNQTFSFDPRSVSAMVLSHAHIDHCGNLPNLIKCGYTGPIYATSATVELADLMVRDAAHIQEADAEFVNKKRARRGEAPIKPLFTLEDAAKVKPFLRDMPYERTFQPVKGVTAHLVEAGHILGSAAVVLDINEDGHKFRLWFSGDIGRQKLPLLKDPVLPSDVDYLMMESTYGDKLHDDPQLAYDELREVVGKTVKRGGKVIIPSFAVGRTQELVYDLNQMISENEIPPIPVYVDSPLAVNTTNIFKEFADYFDQETRDFVRAERHPALSFAGLTYIQSVDESKKLNDRHEPMVIISASGMAETGRILHHLRNNIENPLNTVIIVSWQAPDTLGRRLADHEPQVRIFGETYERRAEVATIGGFSAHADQNALVNYAVAAGDHLKEIYLIHGEPRSAGMLTERLRAAVTAHINYPQLSDTAEL